jgi:hypothetical protein
MRRDPKTFPHAAESRAPKYRTNSGLRAPPPRPPVPGATSNAAPEPAPEAVAAASLKRTPKRYAVWRAAIDRGPRRDATRRDPKTSRRRAEPRSTSQNSDTPRAPSPTAGSGRDIQCRSRTRLSCRRSREPPADAEAIRLVARSHRPQSQARRHASRAQDVPARGGEPSREVRRRIATSRAPPPRPPVPGAAPTPLPDPLLVQPQPPTSSAHRGDTPCGVQPPTAILGATPRVAIPRPPRTQPLAAPWGTPPNGRTSGAAAPAAPSSTQQAHSTRPWVVCTTALVGSVHRHSSPRASHSLIQS